MTVSHILCLLLKCHCHQALYKSVYLIGINFNYINNSHIQVAEMRFSHMAGYTLQDYRRNAEIWHEQNIISMSSLSLWDWNKPF